MSEESFNQFDKFAKAYVNEKDEYDCVMLINGKRFKYKSNVVVFESEAKALKVLRGSAWRWFRWNKRMPNFENVFEEWVKERVSFVPAEDYYRFKRKLSIK
jgi:hypothetical protein